MSNKKTNVGTERSVVAISQEESQLKAVELREEKGTYEVLWTRSGKDTGADWQSFAAECGLSIKPTADKVADSNGDRAVVVGFNSAGVAFYRINIPAVSEEETRAMVKLQAETRLPLPPEQMQLAWRADQIGNGQVGVTIAAARKRPLEEFVESVGSLEPAKILLDCEGIVKAWETIFAGNETNATVVSIAAGNTQVCLVENGRLNNAVVMETGMEDFSAGPEDEQAQAFERFIQDMMSVLELFGYTEQGELPVFVLSDGGPAYVSIVSSLRSAGLDARVALPDTKGLTVPNEIGISGIFEYRVPIGHGVMALESGEKELNIFEYLYKPTVKEEKKSWIYSLKAAFAISAAMLILLLAISYALDVASPGSIEKRLKTSGSEADIDLLMQRQKLIKAVAQQRPDMLDLLGQVNVSGETGIKLESFHFKKGQMVTISGQASGNEQLYKFEKSLQDRQGIKNVKMTSSPDTKTKKLKFTTTFHYKNFTK
jgi:hypothetical protein